MSRVEQELAAREDLAEKLRKLSQYYSEQPPKIRKREFVYVGAILAIIAYHLTAAPQAPSLAQPKTVPPAVAAPCEKYRDVIIAAANQGQFHIGDDVISCRRDKARK
jgi:hypothetical protein